MGALRVRLPRWEEMRVLNATLLKGSLLLIILWLLISTLPGVKAATLVRKSLHQDKKKSLSFAAKQRSHNRAVLLQKNNKTAAKFSGKNHSVNALQASSVPERTLTQDRARNRQLIRANAQWFFPALNADEDEEGVDDSATPTYSNHLQRITQTALERVLQQLGKPYVWGGESPLSGFDCSGLVYYAFNPLLAVKLPRTANEMYRFKQGLRVSKTQLRRGDLIFFAIKSQGEADHVGVYLGKGKFIEAPRTGKDIRISYLNDDFWLERYLGARRMITPNTIL